MLWHTRSCIVLLKCTAYLDKTKKKLDCQCRSPKKNIWRIHTRPSIVAKCFGGPATEFHGRKYAFYSAGQSKTPVDSSGCSPYFPRASGVGFRFSRVLVWLFVHVPSSEDILIFSKNQRISMISGPNSNNQKTSWETYCLHQHSNGDPRKPEFLKKHSKLYRVDRKECIGGFYGPAELNGHMGSRRQL